MCRYVLRGTWSEGTTALRFDPVDIVGRLAAVVHPSDADMDGNRRKYRGREGLHAEAASRRDASELHTLARTVASK